MAKRKVIDPFTGRELDLEPCPFCGSSSLYVSGASDDDSIVCMTCGCIGPDGNSIRVCTARWNNRPVFQ